ncbi:MAG: hypothetical protein SGJ01_05260 [Gemmatimonadota bacterium]|nr:hypothetical protein [Gemmatimonadota bacterium]
MSKPAGRAELSERARSLRTVMWILLAFTVILMLLGFGGTKGWVPVNIGISALILSFATALAAGWLAAKAHARAIADREKQSHGTMIVAIAAQLGQQDDESLRKMQTRGGPAGEAAGLILLGRQERAPRASRAQP